MSFFKLEITGGENPITLNSNIFSAKIWFDTIDDKVLTKSSGVLAKIEIKGRIDEENPEPYLEMFNWAKDFKTKTLYRKVDLKVYSGTDDADLYRHYEYGKMFVVDYQETYAASQDQEQNGSFTLLLTQKDGNWDDVLSFKK